VAGSARRSGGRGGGRRDRDWRPGQLLGREPPRSAAPGQPSRPTDPVADQGCDAVTDTRAHAHVIVAGRPSAGSLTIGPHPGPDAIQVALVQPPSTTGVARKEL